MKKYFILFLLSSLFIQEAFSLSITQNQADQIAEKIWRNECRGTVEGLTHWNKGENFPSFGIGHFIWYPAGKKEPFEETFPELLQFFVKEGVKLPDWLKQSSGCPWNTRENFYEEIHASKMNALRQLLLETKHLQAIFIVNRLQENFPKMIESCSENDKTNITLLFEKLSKDSAGLYALIDYSNFKGNGTSTKETYKGQGWGLLQVLKRIPRSSKEPLIDFVKAAKETLKQRVDNSPPERNEKQWLSGWFNRLDTYLN